MSSSLPWKRAGYPAPGQPCPRPTPDGCRRPGGENERGFTGGILKKCFYPGGGCKYLLCLAILCGKNDLI